MKAKFSKSQLIIFAVAFGVIGLVLFKSFAAPNPNLPGDLNDDNNVNVTDLSILLSNYGTSNTTADINGDGTVSVLDLSALLSHYGQTYSGGSGSEPVANIWVSSGGSDTGANCKRASTAVINPGSGTCASFQKAYNLAICGDVIGVLAGSYPTQNLTANSKTCTSVTPVAFTSVPGGACNDNSLVKLAGYNVSISYTKASCMTVTGDTGIAGSSGQHKNIVWNTLDHMALHDLWEDSDHFRSSYNTYGPLNACTVGQEDLVDFRANADSIDDVIFDHDTFETVTAPPDFECGIGEHVDSMQGYGISNLTISNSRFYGCPGQCIIFRPYAGGVPGPISFINNFFNQAQDPGQAIDLGSSNSADGDACGPGTILIQNNTFVNGAAVHGGFYSGNCSVIFRNNIMTGSTCGFGGSYDTYTYNIFYSGSACGTNSKVCTPSYTGATSSVTVPGDFHLAQNDTCSKDSADPLNFSNTDFDGDARPQGTRADIGADELLGG